LTAKPDSTGEWPQEWLRANEEAFLALSGARSDVGGILARLLRSDTPLDPLLRAALADALEGKRPAGCPHLAVTNIGRGHEAPAGVARFRRDVELAEYTEKQIAEGAKRQDAEREAAAHYGVGEDLCHKAVTGYRKMRRWLESQSFKPPAGVPDEVWENVVQATYLFTVGPLVR
jgi:hypothetical protein